VNISENTRVYIKNFGDGNYMWPEALDRSVLCLISDAHAHQLFKADNNEEYRNYARTSLKTARLKPPDEGIITLWWNTHTKIEAATPDDVFIHDDGKHLYWSQLEDAPITYETRPDPFPRGREGAEVIITLRTCQPWTNLNLKNVPLSLGTIHPHAPHVIRTRMTMAEAKKENSQYILSLLRGESLEFWHSLPDWKETYDKKGKDLGRSFDLWETSAIDIIYNAKEASKQSGKEVISRKKEKIYGFRDDDELMHYIMELHQFQGGTCELTGLKYTPRTPKFRGDMMMSLDRIDNDLGYIRGNLQLTCWFANRWKGSSNNSDFLNLIEKIKSMEHIQVKANYAQQGLT